MPKEEYFVTGAKKDPKDRKDYRLSGIVSSTNIPKQVFELNEDFPPKNQFGRPSCTSQGQTHHKERQEKLARSARFTMALTKKKEGNKEWGAYTRNSFAITKEFGACSEHIMPEPPSDMSWEEYIDHTKIPQGAYDDAKNHKSQSYWRVTGGVEGLRQALTTFNNSIEVSMEWFSEFNRPDNGILPANYSRSAGGHAVDLTGFDDFKELVKFKNSWGTSWGKGGYFYMPYCMFDKLIWDMWCSLDIVDDLPVDNYYGYKRNWASFLRERAVAFNPWLYSKIGRLPNDREIKGLAYGFYSYKSIFEGKVGDLWLNMIKPEAIKNGLINKEENLIN